MDTKIPIEKKVLSKNDELAQEIRQMLKERRILSLNFVSSPGSGKTSLLENTLNALKGKVRMAVIAGDVQTENDAKRLEKTGGGTIRALTTGGACHLDARMILKAIDGLNLDDIDVLFIENVGNLVCPSSFDLGEDMKVVLISTTEGDDNPLKYPSMFRKSSVLILNKTDLLGYSDFKAEEAVRNARNINAALKIFEVSCKTGRGLDNWYTWLANQIAKKKEANSSTV
jgi:hydrogenase nickel incorporation protein HypB